jgi:transposase
MAWTETTRPHYERGLDRDVSDCTDEEWAIIEPFMPRPSRVGRPRKSNLREIWNAIQYIATTGCQWALLPKCFPPFTTVQYYFYGLRDSGILDLLNEALVCVARRLCGRDEEPTAAIIDSQSVKTTEAGGPRAFDAGKKIKGRKRHIVTDTQGHMLTGVVHEANIQDRDGAPSLINLACASFPCIVHIFADGGYAGEKLEEALAKNGGPAIEIVKHPDDAKGFVLVARRWVVERTLAWVNRCRRLAKDWEATIASSEAWLIIASIRQLSRRIARNIR